MLVYLLFLLNIILIVIPTVIDIYKYKITILEYLQRLSLYKTKRKYDYLIHGASCGEILLSIPIVKNLEQNKNRVIVSCDTVSGYRLIKKKLGKTNVVLKPYENIFILLYFFYIMNPENIIIIESDIWPIFIGVVKLLNIRIIAINYKFKPEKPYRNKIHYYLLDKIYLKESVNLVNEKYEFLGNIKLLNCGNSRLIVKKNLLVIISAHCDELEIHCKIIYFCLKNNIKIVYIPRHLNYEKILKMKFRELKYHWLIDKNKNIKKLINDFDLIICYCYGLTNEFLSHSKLSVMGGTFNKIGGHNIFEPIVNHNYLIMGPNYNTCADLYIILNKFKIISVCDNITKLTEEILYLNDRSIDDINKTLSYIDNYIHDLRNKLKYILRQ